jgi:hypothetical protein
MLVRFTVESATAFWKMCCNPGTHWKVEDWYRCGDPTAEVEMAKLHRFSDSKLCTTEKKMVNGQEVEEKTFRAGMHSLQPRLIERAREVVKHYRALALAGKGGLMPLHFAELEAGLRHLPMPGEDGIEDPADASPAGKG